MDLKVTEAAIKAINEMVLENSEDATVRVDVQGYGWGGPRLGLVQGEQKESDFVFEIDGITFLVPIQLDKYVGFSIDYLDAPFYKKFSIRPIHFKSDL